MTNSTNKPTVVFWIIGVVAFLWNAVGVLNYLTQAYLTDELLATLTDSQKDLVLNSPSWVTAAFATAVFGGVLGSLLLLFKKKLANLLFVLSFIGVVVQMTYIAMYNNIYEAYGPGGLSMPVLIILIGIFLIVYSKNQTKKGVLS